MTGPEYQGRVTVDLDGYAPRMRLRAIQAYHALDRAAERVAVAVSSSGEGLHLVGYFAEPVTFGERIKLRRTLGDDPKRIQIDIERALNGVYTGVLWSEKSESGEKVREFADVYDALDWMDGGDDLDPERVARYAVDGHKAEPSLARHVEDPR